MDFLIRLTAVSSNRKLISSLCLSLGKWSSEDINMARTTLRITKTESKREGMRDALLPYPLQHA